MNDIFDGDFLDPDSFETVVMTDENGNDIEFVIMDSIKDEDDRYLLVIEKELMDEEESEAFILRESSEQGNEFLYEIVEDNDEIDRLALLFEESGMDSYEIEIE